MRQARKAFARLITSGSIGLISLEGDAPYDRPPLTERALEGQTIGFHLASDRERKVELHLKRKVESIDVQRKQVTDDQKNVYGYDKLLLATGGGTGDCYPFGEEDIIYYRTVEDYRRLRELTKQHGRFAVIVGGGFIGSEIAAGTGHEQEGSGDTFSGQRYLRLECSLPKTFASL